MTILYQTPRCLLIGILVSSNTNTVLVPKLCMRFQSSFSHFTVSPPARSWKNVVNTNERTWRFSLSADWAVVCCELFTCIPIRGWSGTYSSWRYSKQENISWLTWQMTPNPALLLGNFPFEYIASDKFMYQIKKKLVPFDRKYKHSEVSRDFLLLLFLPLLFLACLSYLFFFFLNFRLAISSLNVV